MILKFDYNFINQIIVEHCYEFDKIIKIYYIEDSFYKK